MEKSANYNPTKTTVIRNITLINREKKIHLGSKAKEVTSLAKGRQKEVITSMPANLRRIEPNNKVDINNKGIKLKKLLKTISLVEVKAKIGTQVLGAKRVNFKESTRLIFNNLVKNLEQKLAKKFTFTNGLSLSILKAFKVYKVSKPTSVADKNRNIKNGVSKLLEGKDFTKREKHILLKASEAVFKHFEERIESLKNEELWLYLLMLLSLKKRKLLESDEEFQKLLSEFIALDSSSSEDENKKEKVISLLKYILTHYSNLLDINEKNALKKRYDSWNTQQMI